MQTAVNGLRVVSCEFRSQAGFLGTLGVTVTSGSVSPSQMVAAIQQRVPGAQPVAGVGEAAVYYTDQKSGGALVQAAKSWRGQTLVVNFAGQGKAGEQPLAALVREAIDAA